MKRSFLFMCILMLVLGILMIVCTYQLYIDGTMKTANQWFIMSFGVFISFFVSCIAFHSYKTSK